MIQRLAVVLWWIGALSVALAVVGAGFAVRHQFTMSGCQPIFAEKAEIGTKAREAARRIVAADIAKVRAESTHFVPVPIEDLPDDLITAQAVAIAKARTAGVPLKDISNDDLLVLLNYDVQTLLQQRAAGHTITGSPAPTRPGFDQELSACEYERGQDTGWIYAVVYLVVALLFFVVSYILGGSFFRPPKI